MTNIKLCGLRRESDIQIVNELKPEYIGFVFAKQSKRYLSKQEAKELKRKLDKEIQAVGVFVDEEIDTIVQMLDERVIDAIQLHGKEDEVYINTLRAKTACMIIKAFCIETAEDIMAANASGADIVLLDSGGGKGKPFDWSYIKDMKKPFFLAGGLQTDNVGEAIVKFSPYGVDASSCLETDGYKDREKMAAFVKAVRQERMDTV